MKHFFGLLVLLLVVELLACVEQFRAEQCSIAGGEWRVSFIDACVYPRKGDAK